MDKEMVEAPATKTEKDIINKSLRADGTMAPEKKKKKEQPNSYSMQTIGAVPISSKRGKFWKARIDQSKKRISRFKESWDEARKYFENDQMQTRDQKNGTISDVSKEIENVVFSNVVALIPKIYSQAPECEISTNFEDETLTAYAECFEKVLNVLATRRESPGLNLKQKARRAIPIAHLTNLAWAEVGYTLKVDSSEQAAMDVEKLGKELSQTKELDKIEEIEGKLLAIDEQYDMLEPAGPKLRVWEPDRIIVDGNAQEADFSDAMWMAKWEYLPTSYIKAKYITKDASGADTLIFKPDFVVKTLSSKESGEGNNGPKDFSIFENDEAASYGYKSNEEYENAKRNKVWFVWDKVTRRVELYLDGNWEWPLWVWNDPLMLDGFFPFYALSFITPINGPYSKGETSYYLDQQDAINDINEGIRLARQWAKWNIWFDTKAIDDATMTKVLQGGNTTHAYGVSLPDGKKLSDVIYSVPPPATEFMELFNKQPLYDVIDRVASVNEQARGGQYKTNTTNKAIEQYGQTSNQKLGDKIDSLEDWLSQIFIAVIQLCLRNMETEEIAALVGPVNAQIWEQAKGLPDSDIKRLLSGLQIVGGSTLKPNSQTKKQEAIDVSQVLGQFASATPAALLVAVEVLKQGFDDIVISPESWDMVMQGIQQAMMPPPPPAGAMPQEGGAAPEGEAQAPPIDPNKLKEILSQVPPEMKQQILQLIESGTPAADAFEQVTGQPVQ